MAETINLSTESTEVARIATAYQMAKAMADRSSPKTADEYLATLMSGYQKAKKVLDEA